MCFIMLTLKDPGKKRKYTYCSFLRLVVPEGSYRLLPIHPVQGLRLNFLKLMGYLPMPGWELPLGGTRGGLKFPVIYLVFFEEDQSEVRLNSRDVLKILDV